MIRRRPFRLPTRREREEAAERDRYAASMLAAFLAHLRRHYTALSPTKEAEYGR